MADFRLEELGTALQEEGEWACDRERQVDKGAVEQEDPKRLVLRDAGRGRRLGHIWSNLKI